MTIIHGARRITIKSIGQSLPVTSHACASVAPVPANPFCFAGGIGLKLCRSLERYTDGKSENMKYTDIDPILEPWSKANGLLLQTEFKGVPVRSWSIVSSTGKEFQMWIEIEGKTIEIKAWDYHKKKWNERATKSTLESGLDKAKATVTSWMVT